MKKLIKRIDDMLVAITFAEAGEFEAAAKIMDERPMAEGDMDESLEVTTEAA
jgi:hypothetical protein